MVRKTITMHTCGLFDPSQHQITIVGVFPQLPHSQHIKARNNLILSSWQLNPSKISYFNSFDLNISVLRSWLALKGNVSQRGTLRPNLWTKLMNVWGMLWPLLRQEVNSFFKFHSISRNINGHQIISHSILLRTGLIYYYYGSSSCYTSSQHTLPRKTERYHRSFIWRHATTHRGSSIICASINMIS